MHARVPPEAAPLVEALFSVIREALGDNLLGVYLSGSIAHGAFDAQNSDVDLVVVTERSLGSVDVSALAILHHKLPPEENSFGRDYDVYYIDRSTLWRHALNQSHFKVGAGEPLHKARHRPNWVIERWILRKRGVTVAGTEARKLIAPVSVGALRRAARDELGARLSHWTTGKWPLRELQHRGAQAFEIETVCRALYTTEAGEVCAKDEAIGWALNSLPPEWHVLIRWSSAHRKDPLRDDARAPEVLRFLEWAVAS